MLINFTVENFRSIKSEQYFSMEKGKNIRKYKNNVRNLGKVQVVKSAVIFGGNAGGKTNLLLALQFLRTLILQPTTSENQSLPTDTFGYNDDPTSFAIEFEKNGQRFLYRLVYQAKEILEETLRVDGALYFARSDRTFSKLPAQLLPVEKNIRRNQNLLYFAQANNNPVAKLAFSWFLEDLVMVKTSQAPNRIFKALEEATFKKDFLQFVRAADFNIIDIEVKQKKVEVPAFQTDFAEEFESERGSVAPIMTTVYEVYTTHQAAHGTFQLAFNNESSGSKAFMFLALYILINKNSGKVLLMDEFDKAFHFELAEALLDVFHHERQVNQFILTTHELALMDDNLRQDQIWFADRNQYGETELFSIYDFDDDALKRSDFGYKKRYLEGRYGANQIVAKSVLLEVMEGEDGKQEEKAN